MQLLLRLVKMHRFFTSDWHSGRHCCLLIRSLLTFCNVGTHLVLIRPGTVRLLSALITSERRVFESRFFFLVIQQLFFWFCFFPLEIFFFSADLKLHIPQNGSLKGSWRGIVDERKQYRAPLKWDLFLFLHILWDICSTIMSLLTGHSHRQTAFPSVSRRI